jgi:hypothetical protein
LRSAISSRSASERYRPESGFAEDLNIDGGMPPAFRNNLGPAAGDTPALSAASSLFSPAAIACQNLACSARPATGGRPGERKGARVDRFFRIAIATSNLNCCDDRLNPPLTSSIEKVENTGMTTDEFKSSIRTARSGDPESRSN